jgi:hypothetical protein
MRDPRRLEFRPLAFSHANTANGPVRRRGQVEVISAKQRLFDRNPDRAKLAQVNEILN